MNGDFLSLAANRSGEEISPEALLETVRNLPSHRIQEEFRIPGRDQGPHQLFERDFPGFLPAHGCGRVEDPTLEVSLEEARKVDADLLPGEILEQEVTTNSFGRIAAQTAKQVVVQRIREAEREKVFEEFNERVGEVVTGSVLRREFKNIIIGLWKDRGAAPTPGAG